MNKLSISLITGLSLLPIVSLASDSSIPLFDDQNTQRNPSTSPRTREEELRHEIVRLNEKNKALSEQNKESSQNLFEKDIKLLNVQCELAIKIKELELVKERNAHLEAVLFDGGRTQ